MTRLHLPLFVLLLVYYASARKTKPFMALLYRSVAPSRTYRLQNVAPNQAEGYIDEIYTVHMNVGSSRQMMNLTLDYGWGPTFLFGGGHKSCGNPRQQRNENCVPRRERLPHGYFNALRSRTFFNTQLNYGFTLESPFTRNCGKFPLAGDIVEDQIQVDKATFNGLPFVLTHDSIVDSLLHPGWSSDGILGLGYWSGFFGTSQYSFILKMLESFDQKLVTVYLGNIWRHKEFHWRNEPAGWMTLGARDAEHCDSNWRYVTASWTYGWSVVLDKFQMGSYTQPGRAGVGVLASPTAYIYAPKHARDGILSQTDAEYDPKTDVYFVDCSRVGSMPDMVFWMQGFEYRIKGKYYASQLYIRGPNPKKQCILFVGESSREDTWFLGTRFNRPYCTLFDFTSGDMKMAFARALMD